MGNYAYTLQSYYQHIAQHDAMLLDYQFLVTFTVGNDTSGTNSIDIKQYPNFANGITLLCQSSTIPRRTLQTAKINFFAKRFSVPTTEKFDHQWNMDILLTHDMAVYSELRKMVLAFSNLRNNGGGIRTIPNINIQVDILDQFSETGKKVQDVPRFTLVGCFPTNVGKLDLKYSDANSTVMKANVTWTYQFSYIDRLHDPAGKANPLLYSPPINV